MPSDDRGLVDVDALRSVLDRDVAGIMLTNPNTLGLFEEEIDEIAAAVHEVGGLLYYDGANLNAILGRRAARRHGLRHRAPQPPQDVRDPARRGRARVRVRSRSRSGWPTFLPGSAAAPCRATAGSSGRRRRARSGGSTPGTATRSCSRARTRTCASTVPTACVRVAQRAVLNANWLRVRLSPTPTLPPSTARACTRWCSPRPGSRSRRRRGARRGASGSSKEGFHAPTVYFPLIVDEALMVEPTETESPQTLESRSPRRSSGSPRRRSRTPSAPTTRRRRRRCDASTRRARRAHLVATEDDRTP